MEPSEFDEVSGPFSRDSVIPKGEDIYYQCTKCGQIVSSVTKKSFLCKCGSVGIDIDYFKCSVLDLSEFKVLRKRST